MRPHGREVTMAEESELGGDGLQPWGPPLGEGVLHNGIDETAARRAHMRTLTMARQAAERRCAHPPAEAGLDRPARLAARREREAELRVELARIDAAHRSWLDEQGLDVPECRRRIR
jgi:hypothetical protein